MGKTKRLCKSSVLGHLKTGIKGGTYYLTNSGKRIYCNSLLSENKQIKQYHKHLHHEIQNQNQALQNDNEQRNQQFVKDITEDNNNNDDNDNDGVDEFVPLEKRFIGREDLRRVDRKLQEWWCGSLEFNIVKLLGHGSFGKVYQVCEKDKKKMDRIKVMKKMLKVLL